MKNEKNASKLECFRPLRKILKRPSILTMIVFLGERCCLKENRKTDGPLNFEKKVLPRLGFLNLQHQTHFFETDKQCHFTFLTNRHALFLIADGRGLRKENGTWIPLGRDVIVIFTVFFSPESKQWGHFCCNVEGKGSYGCFNPSQQIDVDLGYVNLNILTGCFVFIPVAELHCQCGSVCDRREAMSRLDRDHIVDLLYLLHVRKM